MILDLSLVTDYNYKQKKKSIFIWNVVQNRKNKSHALIRLYE
jgi:hypothetical protein